MDYKKIMHELVDKNFDEMVKGIQSQLQYDSVLQEDKMTKEHPFGAKLTEALNAFLKYGESLGFKSKNVANAAGHLELGDGESIIGVLCHLDIVPAGKKELWSHDPFSGTIADNKIYGRGSTDDKGPAISALFAIKALVDSGVKLNKKYRLILGLDEESGLSRCLQYYFKDEKYPDYSFSPDAFFPVINGEKGIMRFEITHKYKNAGVIDKVFSGERYNIVPEEAEAVISLNDEQLQKFAAKDVIISKENSKTVIRTKGVSAHAMQPQVGDNALLKLLAIFDKLNLEGDLSAILKMWHRLLKNEYNGQSMGISCSDEISGELTCNPAVIRTENGVCTMKFDVRYPVTIKGADVASRLKKTVMECGGDLNISQDKEPLYMPADNPFVQTLLSAYNDITGSKAKPICIGGGTYCRFLKNSVSFGPQFPGDPDVNHQTDEHITFDNLRKATHIYAEALFKLNDM